MMREKTKMFWSNRANTDNMSDMEQINFQNDEKIAELYEESEGKVVFNELSLSKNDVVVDLGAAKGRYSLQFATKVKRVIAVEFIKEFSDEIITKASNLSISNIEIVNSSSDEFCREECADIVFVSGLFIYLDDEQFNKTASNIVKTLKQKGILFIRESSSILENEIVVDKYSEELGSYYCSLYRTPKKFIETFEKLGLTLNKYEPMFADGSILNKRKETRMYYYVFHKQEEVTNA